MSTQLMQAPRFSANLDILRAMAVLFVLFAHCLDTLIIQRPHIEIGHFSANLGRFGVLLFFVRGAASHRQNSCAPGEDRAGSIPVRAAAWCASTAVAGQPALNSKERGIARRPAVRADGAVHAGLAAGARRRRLRGRQPAKRGIEGQGGRSGGFLAVDLAGSRAVAASPVPT